MNPTAASTTRSRLGATVFGAVGLSLMLSACAPLAVQLTKELAMWGLDQPTLAGALAEQIERPAFRRWMASEDAREGPRAFAEKRPAEWKGR